MITFDEARAKAAAAGHPAADYGWENDNVYVIAFDYGDELPPFDEPDRLVDKHTSELREVYGLLSHDPAPNLRPIGNPPNRAPSTMRSGVQGNHYRRRDTPERN